MTSQGGAWPGGDPRVSPENKLGLSLRQLADDASPQPVSVIVELDVPGPKIKLDRSARREQSHWAYGRVEAETETDQVRLKKAMTEARRFLKEVAGSDPVWLSASRAFVVDTTANRLIEIAREPFVRQISENQLRR